MLYVMINMHHVYIYIQAGFLNKNESLGGGNINYLHRKWKY